MIINWSMYDTKTMKGIHDLIYTGDILVLFKNKEQHPFTSTHPSLIDIITDKNQINDYMLNNKNIIDLTSEYKKFFIDYHHGLLHSITDTMSIMLNNIELCSSKNSEVILVDFFSEHDNIKNFIKNFAEKNNFNLKIVDFKNFDGFKINNVDFISRKNVLFYKEACIKNIHNWFIKEYPINTLPTKKIYLSRRKAGENVGATISDNSLTYPNFGKKRIMNEQILESFLEKNNFEIIYPEDFKTLDDQICFMRNVKTVASTTSSGLANIFFMNSGTNIIEFVSTHGFDSEYEELHSQYFTISYMLNNNHYAIQNKDRNAETLVQKIKESKILNIV